jgi:hypothetical protein
MPKRIDLLNKKYGLWTVIEYSHSLHGDRYWKLKCVCGAERVMAKKTLNRGKLKPCVCNTKSSPVNMVGARFGKLLVIEPSKLNPKRKYDYKCLCDCGESIVVFSSNLINGYTSSCGCYYMESNKRIHGTHGHTFNRTKKSSEYNCWVAIKQRCYDKNHSHYSHYGGRGIRVCQRWIDSFENFLSDMGIKPSPSHSIERNDVNGNYEPSNCRWATSAEQAVNKRNSVWYTYNGKEYPRRDLAKLLGVSSSSFVQMLNKTSLEETIMYYTNKKNGNNNSR